MKFGNIIDLRHAIGGTKPPQDPKVSRSYAAALKKCAGLIGRVKFDVGTAMRYLKSHPEFKQTDALPIRSRRYSRSSQKAATAGKSHG